MDIARFNTKGEARPKQRPKEEKLSRVKSIKPFSEGGKGRNCTDTVREGIPQCRCIKSKAIVEMFL